MLFFIQQRIHKYGILDKPIAFRSAIHSFLADGFHDAAFTGIDIQGAAVGCAGTGNEDFLAAVAAYTAAIIDQNHIEAFTSRLNSRAHAGHPCPYHNQIGIYLLLFKTHTVTPLRIA